MNLTMLRRKAFMITCAALLVAMGALVTAGFAQPSVASAAAGASIKATPDGRLNNTDFIPFAVYCNTQGVTILKITAQSQGVLALVVDMPTVLNGIHQAAQSGINFQIGSSGFISVWALSSAEIEAVLRDPAQPPYNFIFGLDRCNPIDVDLVTPVPGASATPGGPGTTSPNGFLYTVQPGDTLFTIALRFNTSMIALSLANNLGWNWTIYAGQQLVIPAASGYGYVGSLGPTPMPYATPVNYSVSAPCSSPYLVMIGDTLNLIALRCNRSVAAIAQANGIVNPNYIQAGQWLVIPGP